jgi:dipeptidyl-peptidase-4
VIYRPSDYAPSKTYPILDLEYNSPIVVVTPRHFMQAAAFPFDDFNTPAAAAELGLIVVMMDARGTPFRGAAFSDPTPGYIASMGLDDHVAVIKALAARDPSMDMRHVGISGASFGAWTVIRALENYNSVFSVGVAWAPPGAFYNMYDANLLTSSSGIPRYDGGAILRPSPTARPDNWTSIDSIAQVGEMQGALLLGSGALDENVVPGSPLQFFEAATRADKHVEQVFLPNATHGPIAYLPYMVRRVWDFMVVNLRREVPPEDFHVPSAAPPAS